MTAIVYIGSYYGVIYKARCDSPVEWIIGKLMIATKAPPINNDLELLDSSLPYPRSALSRLLWGADKNNLFTYNTAL